MSGIEQRSADRRAGFTPPPRPDWVQRINDEGACMNIRGVVPMDEESLIAAACQATGLSDFGADDWREPFGVLVRAMDIEADLNLMGRLRTRSEILQLLEARLQIEDTYKRHPEIGDERIDSPIIIVGQGRSGTSFLENLLMQDPDNGVMRHWEAVYPCPPPEAATYHSDPRIAQAHAAIDQWNRVVPELASMHEFAADIPIDDCLMHAMNFMAPAWFISLGQVPSYDAYMATVPQEPALEYEKRVLKLLQWRNPRRRWVLKDPMHLDRMETLLKVFPGACLVWPHRDPTKVMGSVVNMLGTIQWGRSDHPLKNRSFEAVLDPDLAAARLDAVIDRIETGAIPRDRLFNLQYADLVADPIGTAERLYGHFGLVFTDAARSAMVAYMAAAPRETRPAHKVRAASEEALSRERRAFRHYQDYFGVASE